MAPPGKHAASAFAFAFPAENAAATPTASQEVMAEKVADRGRMLVRGAELRPDVVRRERDVAYLMLAEIGANRAILYVQESFRPGTIGSYQKSHSDPGGLYLAARDAMGPGITFIPGTTRATKSSRTRAAPRDFANPLTSRMLAANTSGMTPGTEGRRHGMLTTIRPTRGTPARTSCEMTPRPYAAGRVRIDGDDVRRQTDQLLVGRHATQSVPRVLSGRIVSSPSPPAAADDEPSHLPQRRQVVRRLVPEVRDVGALRIDARDLVQRAFSFAAVPRSA